MNTGRSQTTSRPKRGFTLVESLTYVAILSVVSIGSITLLFNLNELFLQYQVRQELLTTGSAALERVLTELRQAESVDPLNSVFASSSAGVLVLERGATTTTFARTGSSTLMVSVNGVNEGQLTTTQAAVDGFTVYRYVLTDGELIRIKLTLSASVGEYSNSITLYGGAVIRGSYE